MKDTEKALQHLDGETCIKEVDKVKDTEKALQHLDGETRIKEVDKIEKSEKVENDNERITYYNEENRVTQSIEYKGEDASNTGFKKIITGLGSMRSVSNMFFLFTMFVQGFSHMVYIAYLFLLMKDKMHSNRTIMGLSTFVSALAQIAVFPFADRVVDFCGGRIVSMELAVFSWSVRHMINSYIVNPWLVLPSNLLHAFSFPLFWAAAIGHTKKIAPVEIYFTVFSVFNSMYYGAGGISANYLGGLVYSR